MQLLPQIKNLIIFVILLTLPLVSNANTTLPVQQAINKILANNHEDLNVGIIVANLTKGTVLYEKNPSRLFLPASNMKLLTAFAALSRLGANFSYQTTLYANTQQLQNGVLNGNIGLRFSGDPELTSAQLNSLIHSLSLAGIQQVNGAFIVDNHAYDNMGFGPGWMWDDRNYCFGEPINAVIVDHNCFSVNIFPARQANRLSHWQAIQAPLFANLNNQIHTVSGTNSLCPINIHSGDNNDYTLNGCVAAPQNDANASPITLEIATRNPPLYATQLISHLLQKNHIVVTQGVQIGTVAPNASILAILHSKPLSQILSDMLKPSDNLIANSLFKKLGEINSQRIGSWETGKKAMQAILQKQLLIEPQHQKIVDGSGESRYDLVTPQQILVTLLAVYHNPVLANTYIPALPISGIDGTIQSRMTAPDLKGRVLAKTGSMAGVSSLSGFIKTTHHQTLAFVILMNNFVGPENKYRALQDKICAYLARQM